MSLRESWTPGIADTAISTAGQQTVSYDLSDASVIKQRIDRTNKLGDYWTFYRPQLDGDDASMVVRSGTDGLCVGLRTIACSSMARHG